MKNIAYEQLLTRETPLLIDDIFRQHQRQVKQAVDKAKDTWIMKTASIAEKTLKDGSIGLSSSFATTIIRETRRSTTTSI